MTLVFTLSNGTVASSTRGSPQNAPSLGFYVLPVRRVSSDGRRCALGLSWVGEPAQPRSLLRPSPKMAPAPEERGQKAQKDHIFRRVFVPP